MSHRLAKLLKQLKPSVGLSHKDGVFFALRLRKSAAADLKTMDVAIQT